MKNASVLRALALATLLLPACSSSDTSGGGRSGGIPSVTVTPTPAPEGSPYATLDEWHLFADARAQTPAEGVIPYDVNAPLFSDYTAKLASSGCPRAPRSAGTTPTSGTSPSAPS